MEDVSVPVTALSDVGPGAIALDVETPPDFDARPGQFVKVSATIDGEEESRFYTISSPRVAEQFELTIEIDPAGELSPRLAALEPGDSVVLSGPYGNAYYEDEPRILVMAGGPGIGPAVGIAERSLADDGDPAVVYRDDDPLHGERLDQLRAAGVTVQVLDTADPLVEPVRAAGLADRQVFVYGFADFLDDAMGAIAAAGGEPDRAKVENFG